MVAGASPPQGFNSVRLRLRLLRRPGWLWSGWGLLVVAVAPAGWWLLAHLRPRALIRSFSSLSSLSSFSFVVSAP